MKRDSYNIQKILFWIIGVLGVILAAVLIYKGYALCREKIYQKELNVRNQEIQSQLEGMQTQIKELSDDSKALQEFLDEKINRPNEKEMTDTEEVPDTKEVSDTEAISESEDSVSVNETDTEETVSGNEQEFPLDNGESDTTLEGKRSMRPSYVETMQINGEDKARIANGTIDFSDMKIACLGDSLTAGDNLNSLEDYRKYSYPSVLKNVLNVQEVYNLGIGGSSYGRYWDKAFVERYKEIPKDSDIIIVMGGTNDGFAASLEELGNIEEKKPRTFYGDVDELMRGLKEDYPDAKIIFVTPLPNVLHDYLMSQRDYLLPQNVFVNAIVELAAEYGIDVIDLYNSNMLDTHDAQIISTYMPDGVHGNPGGYQILAEHIASEIIRIMEEDALYGSTVSGNSPAEESVSGNAVADASTSGNEVSGNEVPGNAVTAEVQEIEEEQLSEEEKKKIEENNEKAADSAVIVTPPPMQDEIQDNASNSNSVTEEKEETQNNYEYGGEAIIIQ
ncbi:MAG: SGNH/GDSL hydrolase family protein [Clostridiales bacterium]|nr:SGNH/GDSL hydrolase family protein [Clostridiales bacterium]